MNSDQKRPTTTYQHDQIKQAILSQGVYGLPIAGLFWLFGLMRRHRRGYRRVLKWVLIGVPLLTILQVLLFSH